MFRLNELRELIKLIDESSINEFVVSDKGYKVVIKKEGENVQVVEPSVAPTTVQQPVQVPQASVAPAATPATEATPAPAPAPEQTSSKEEEEDDSQYHKIVSPIVGTFYAAPSPDADPYVKVGDKISKDSIVCIVEAMKLFNEIEAEVEGTIVKVLVENGQLVEYNQPLFLVKTNS